MILHFEMLQKKFMNFHYTDLDVVTVAMETIIAVVWSVKRLSGLLVGLDSRNLQVT